MSNYKQGPVKQITVEIDGVKKIYDTTMPVVLDGRVINQISLGVNIGTKVPFIVFFADKDAAGNENPHIVARMSPDSKVPDVVFYPPNIGEPTEEPTEEIS